MNAIFKQTGNRVDYTPGSAVSAGAIVVQENLVGVATEALTANVLASLAIAGVFDVEKATSGVTFSAGDNVFWNTSTEKAVTAAGTNVVYFGKAIEAAAETDSTVRVALLQLENIADLDPAAEVTPTQETLTDNITGTADATIADVAPAAAITDNSGGIDPGDDTIAAVTNLDTLTDSTGGTADDTVDDVSTAVTGVDGSGSNAASKADVDTRLSSINNNFKELVDQIATQEAANTAILAAIAQLAAKMNTNRTAIVTLTANEKDIVAQLANIETDVAAVISALQAAGLMVSS